MIRVDLKRCSGFDMHLNETKREALGVHIREAQTKVVTGSLRERVS